MCCRERERERERERSCRSVKNITTEQAIFSKLYSNIQYEASVDKPTVSTCREYCADPY